MGGALIYNSSSKWANTNLTHNLLTDTSISSIVVGDILRWNGTSFINSSSLTSDETKMNINLSISQNFMKNASSIAQNGTITTTYVDGTDQNILFVNTSSAFYAPLVSVCVLGLTQWHISAAGNSILGNVYIMYNWVQSAISFR